MRRIAFFIIVVLKMQIIGLFAQTTENFNYQAVIRDNDGELISNQQVDIRLTIIESTASGNEIYRETHDVTTSEQGMINLLVGNGSSDLGTFTSINWGNNSKFIKLEVDIGNGFVDMGTFQLFSVPFANYALNVENNDDADPDPTNEIQDLNLSDDVLTITGNPSPTAINLAPFTGNNTDEQELTLNGDTLIISNGNKVVLPYDSSSWIMNGEQIYYNAGNVGIGSSAPVSNLEVKANVAGTEALFQVINANNDTVFAVYPDGVKIFVDSQAKGKVGGFAVSGRNPSKAGDIDILKVTIDSTRIYVNESLDKAKVGGFAVSGRNPSKGVVHDYLVVTNDSTRVYVEEPVGKAKVGGFAVSGRNPSKGVVNDYLVVTNDSTRIYVEESASKAKVGGFAVSGRNPSKGSINEYIQINKDSTRIYVAEPIDKAKVGGFAVSGRNPSKGPSKDYFNISPNFTAEVINNESRVMWYPGKSALLAGELFIPSADSVGEYSLSLGYKNLAIGDWSQAMGYMSVARGEYSTAIGYETVADTNSFAFGRGTKALGFNSFAFGSNGVDSLGNPTSSYTKATEDYSFAFGLGSEASGIGSFVMGTNCSAIGNFSSAAGFESEATGWNATAMGAKNVASGNYSLAIGANNQAQGAASVAFGLGNSAEGLQSMVAGSDNTAVGVASVVFGSSNSANGDGTFIAGKLNSSTQTAASAIGQGNTASGAYSFATGSGTEAAGQASISAGLNTTANGDYSLVIGQGTETTANGDESFAAGLNTTASGRASIASGTNTESSGNYSVALGNNIESHAFASLVIGQYNASISASATTWSTSDPVFVVGNGYVTNGWANDAFVVYKNGNAKIDGDLYPADDGANDLGILGSNDWNTVYAISGVSTSSDKRLKSNILNISYGLKDVLKLRPVSFLWRDKPEQGMKLGLIAQEVQPVIKEIVDVGNDENNTLSLRYSDLIPVLIKSIQEQQSIIDEQARKNEELEAKLKELNDRLIILEKK